jgi:hypothetical protein
MIRDSRALVFLQVAGCTRGAQADKLAHRGSLVARIAISESVGPQQWEPVLMFSHSLNGHTPTAHCVALLAIPAQLAPVNVRVALRAVSPHVREDQLNVALAAGHGLMSTTQRIRGLIVAKVRCGPYRGPVRRGVTTFACDSQGSVRIACSSDLARCIGMGGRNDHQQNQP